MVWCMHNNSINVLVENLCQKFITIESVGKSSLVVILLDLLTVEPHMPTSEPVRYDKKDGQWYTHNGVDVKDTQQRKGFNSFSYLNLNIVVLSKAISGGLK